MPVMDGYEATRKIKMMKNNNGVNPVIVGLSAMNGEKEIRKWFEDGIDYFCKHTNNL
jgi:CheY-like chemotaxis protein